MPLSPNVRATVERRGPVVLIGINRPDVFNRFDPETSHALAVAFTGYEHDESLRCAILFPPPPPPVHGDNFSRGIDVDAHKANRRRAGGRSRRPGELYRHQRQKG